MRRLVAVAVVLCISLVAGPARADGGALGEGSATMTFYGQPTLVCQTEGVVSFNVMGSSWLYNEHWGPGTPATNDCVDATATSFDAGSDQIPDTSQCVMNYPFLFPSPNKLSRSGNVYTLTGTGKCGSATLVDQVVLTVGASTIGLVHTLLQGGRLFAKTVASLSRLR